MRSLAAAMFTCVYLIVAGVAYAELTEVDLFLDGDGLVTRDDATGLDWLDLTATTNLSFNDILAGADGWVDGGWRHATGQEVCSLFNSIEELLDCSPPLGRQAVAGTFELWLGPQALFGVTQDEPDRDRSLGIYDQEDEGESDRVGRGAIAIFPVAETVQSEILTDQFFETTSSSLVGHWLVRLPEPSPDLLAGAALLTLAGLRRLESCTVRKFSRPATRVIPRS